MLSTRIQRLRSKLAHRKAGAFVVLFLTAWCTFGATLERFAPNFHHRHVVGDWLAPRWHSVWDLVLLVAVAVWCAHGALRLRDAIAERKRPDGMRSAKLRWALMQVVLAVALGAYSWVILTAPSEEIVVTATGTSIHGEFYRALKIEPRTPELRRWQSPPAWLERRAGTTRTQIRVERGQWWDSGVGPYRLAMARARISDGGAVLRHGRERMTLDVEKPKQRGLLTFLLRAVHRRDRRSSAEVKNAEVDIGGSKHVIPLDPEWAGENAFLGMKESPVIVLRVHRNRSFELVILALALLMNYWASRRLHSKEVASDRL